MTAVEILARFASVARPIILQEFRADSCIASSAITMKVLSHFDLAARPFPCKLMVLNDAFVNRLETEGHWPTPDETIRWCEDGQSWSVGVGFSHSSEPEVGHLIVIVGEKYLVDASFDQASRPTRNLALPGVLVQPVPSSFRRSLESFPYEGDGYVAIYEPAPKNKVWRSAPDWTEASRHTSCVEKIIVAMG